MEKQSDEDKLRVLPFRVSSWDCIPFLVSASRKVFRLQGGEAFPVADVTGLGSVITL